MIFLYMERIKWWVKIMTGPFDSGSSRHGSWGDVEWSEGLPKVDHCMPAESGGITRWNWRSPVSIIPPPSLNVCANWRRDDCLTSQGYHHFKAITNWKNWDPITIHFNLMDRLKLLYKSRDKIIICIFVHRIFGYIVKVNFSARPMTNRQS